MREILFRGKRLDNGAWETGSLVIVRMGCHDAQYFIADKMTGYHTPVDPSTVGQYTGLKDKNGKRIFEGDVVVCRQEIAGNFIDCHIEIGFVEMKHGAFGLHRKQGYYRPFKDWLENYEYEVIGNIHDNPELLKGGDD